MPTPIRGKKNTQQHNRSEKARANPCSDAIITHNQIRADLNRHRTQNHIKGNSMCMALHCSQSRLFSVSALASLILSLTFLLHFSPSFFLSVIITIASRLSNASDLKNVLPVTSLSRSSALCLADGIPQPRRSLGTKSAGSSCHR